MINKELLLKCDIWPLVQAKKILEKINYQAPKKSFVLFCTGYGPSGLPHIGTFGEVVRTNYVKFAFSLLAPDIPTKLLVISDDMDGLRKVPDNIPNKEMIKNYIGKPLTSIPDPFNEKESYGHFMNDKLKSFCDNFGFEYEFLSATEGYKNGLFNDGLQKAAEKYQELMEIMLPTLGQERQETYSPFMPIDLETGIVLANGVISINPIKQTIKYKHKEIEKEISYLNGNCKLQWKCDFGMRWYALEVDYESYGKDHLPNQPIYRAICETLGNKPPVNYFYELFLDEEGKKISKSKGNGVSVEKWLRYANIDSLSYYMFLKPQTAKKLSLDLIPKVVDEYLRMLNSYDYLNDAENIKNPIFYIYQGKNIKKYNSKITYSILLNITAACSPDKKEVLLEFLKRYDENIDINDKLLLELVEKSINYYYDFIHNKKVFLKAEGKLLDAATEFKNELKSNKYQTEKEIQDLAYDIGNKYSFDLQKWFSYLYQIMLGLPTGPRIGSFIKIYGIENSIKLLP